MSKRHQKRRRQSEKDKNDYYYRIGRQLSDPLGDYRKFLERTKTKSIKDFVRIPPSLVDLTACIIISLLIQTQGPLAALVSLDPTTTQQSALYTDIVHLISKTSLSYTTCVMALLMTMRAATHTRGKHHLQKDPLQTYIAALICSDKYLYDATYTNREWSVFLGRYSLLEINEMERVFLSGLDYRMFVEKTEFDQFLEFIDLALSLRQIYTIRTWRLSYRELLQLSDSMPTSKQWRAFRASYLNELLSPLDSLILIGTLILRFLYRYLLFVSLLILIPPILLAIHTVFKFE